MSYYQYSYAPPKRAFDFSAPAQLHKLDHSQRILTDEDFLAHYPEGVQPVGKREVTVAPAPAPLPIPHTFPRTTPAPAARTPLTAFQALRDSTQKTMHPVKKSKPPTLPGKKAPVKPEMEKPDWYFKRPDGSLYYHCKGTMCDRGFITSKQA